MNGKKPNRLIRFGTTHPGPSLRTVAHLHPAGGSILATILRPATPFTMAGSPTRVAPFQTAKSVWVPGRSILATILHAAGRFVLAASLALGVVGCGGGEPGSGSSGSSEAPGPGSAEPASELTDWQMENGIGPMTEPLELGAIDPALAGKGEEIFNLKCAACHKLDERYVAPPLRDVTARRTPEFVMNMMLNPLEMTQRHPVTRELLGEYFTPMTPQGLTEGDARALLEYLRKAYAHGPGGG